jgi:uncharacterized membrane protein
MNNVKFTTYMNVLKIAIASVGVLLCLFLFTGPNIEQPMSEVEDFRDGMQLSAAIWFFIIILLSCIALVLGFFVFQLISNPKKTLMSIIGLVVAFVIYLILWAIGTSDTAESLNLLQSIGEVESSTISSTTAGLYTVLIGLALAVLAIAVSPFLGRLRK